MTMTNWAKREVEIACACEKTEGSENDARRDVAES